MIEVCRCGGSLEPPEVDCVCLSPEAHADECPAVVHAERPSPGGRTSTAVVFVDDVDRCTCDPQALLRYRNGLRLRATWAAAYDADGRPVCGECRGPRRGDALFCKRCVCALMGHTGYCDECRAKVSVPTPRALAGQMELDL